MEIPKKLYKYEPFNELTLRNLKKQAVHFSSPKHFNDPYDCAIATEINELLDEQLAVCRSHLLNKKDTTDEMKEAIKAYTNFDLKEMLRKVVKEEIDSNREKLFSKIGITCLSERNDDLLMWSHYGGKYKGFCLEFDTKHAPFTKARKVNYSEQMPKIDPLPLITKNQDNQFMDLFCFKSKSWEYEKEWRVFHAEAGTLFGYLPEALTSIYFGPDMDYECFEIIALILGGQNPNVKLFQGKRSTKFFKVEFEEVTYTPHIVAKKLGLK